MALFETSSYFVDHLLNLYRALVFYHAKRIELYIGCFLPVIPEKKDSHRNKDLGMPVRIKNTCKIALQFCG
jgi:hypothetical protein